MANYYDLIKAIAGAERESEMMSNPWLSAAAMLQKSDVTSSTADPWKNVAAALGKGITAGLMHGWGEGEARQESMNTANALVEALKSGNAAQYAANHPVLGQYAGEIQGFEAAREQEQADEMRQLIQKSQLNPQKMELPGNKLQYFQLAQGPDGSIMREPIGEVAERWNPNPRTVVNVNNAKDNIFANLPATEKAYFATIPATVNGMERLAEKYDKLESKNAVDTLNFQLKSSFMTTDEGKLRGETMILGKQLQRALEGGRGSDQDFAVYKKVLQGDKFVDPKDVAQMIRNVASSFKAQAQDKLKGYQSMQQGTDAYMEQFNQAPQPVNSSSQVDALGQRLKKLGVIK